MSQSQKSSRLFLVGIMTLILPFIVLGGLVAQNVMLRETGAHWKIKIDGYDPRDILQGQYLRYQYDWNWADSGSQCPFDNAPCCVCVLPSEEGNGNTNPRAKSYSCTDPAVKHCETMLKGWSGYNGNFTLSKKQFSNSYYISEEFARDIEKAVWDDSTQAYVEISIQKNHKAYVRNLWVGDMTIEDYIRSLPRDMSVKSSR